MPHHTPLHHRSVASGLRAALCIDADGERDAATTRVRADVSKLATYLPSLLCLLVLLAWTSPTHAQASTQDRRLVARLVTRWEQSWNSYDLREVDSLFFREESVTYFSSERAGLISGIDRLREHHKGFGFKDGGTSSANRLWLADTVSRWNGRVATVLATWHFRRADGTQQSGPVTLVVAPRGRGFRISHAHFSNAPKE